jgi:hypothetical protein
MLIAKLDAQSRAYRWLHEGLHRLDFYLGYRRLTRSGLKS